MQRRIVGLMFIPAVVAALISWQRNPLAAQSSTNVTKSPRPLILQENDGEHLLRRPGGPIAAATSVPEFIIKVDKQNGNAEDFLVSTEVMGPGGTIPFHMHHNSEEVLVLEEGGATVTVGDQRAVAGPHSVVFIPRDTWVSVTNTGKDSVHIYGLFSRQGFENFFRARSVHPGEPLTPLTLEEVRRAADEGHAMVWDTSKGPYPRRIACTQQRKNRQKDRGKVRQNEEPQLELSCGKWCGCSLIVTPSNLTVSVKVGEVL